MADLQIEYSLISRGIEPAILPAARELGVGVTAYGVLSRGLLSGTGRATSALPRGTSAPSCPRFQRENVDRNLAAVEASARWRTRKGATVAQLAIAWVLARGSDIVPLVGARRRERLAEALGALELDARRPTTSGRSRPRVPPGAIAGTRYDPQQMQVLDSERA